LYGYDSLLTDLHWRAWAGIVLATALGPVFLLTGIANPNFILPATYVLSCIFVVPLVILVAGRSAFLAWQLAIVSLSLAFLEHDLRIVAQYDDTMRASEIASVVFVLWVIGTLFSSPLPVYLLLRPMSSRKRYIASIAVGAAALALWFGMKKITG